MSVRRRWSVLTASFVLSTCALCRAEEKPTPWPGPQAGKSPLKVFILAGQSNMEGQAVADLEGKHYNEGKGTLMSLLRDPAKSVMVAHLRKGDAWTVRDDVWVSFQAASGHKTGGLSVGFAGYGGRHHFGPELQFGHVMGDALDNQVLIIKTAWGGKSLFKEFRPPSSGGETGEFYTRMIQEVRECLGDIKKHFPAYDGRGYELAGLVWYQGWNDGCGPKGSVEEYERNLLNLIADFRKEFNAPRLPVVVGELTGPWVEATGRWADLRRAQAAAARNAKPAGTVAFVETHDFVRKPEDSPNPGHGHHEFGNAETYFLVGQALGEGMKKLMAGEASEKR